MFNDYRNQFYRVDKNLYKMKLCTSCGGSGWNGTGTGYDGVCDGCAGDKWVVCEEKATPLQYLKYFVLLGIENLCFALVIIGLNFQKFLYPKDLKEVGVAGELSLIAALIVGKINKDYFDLELRIRGAKCP